MATATYFDGGSWADAFAAADFNALASGAGKLSTATAYDNSTLKYFHLDLSFITVTSTMTITAGDHLAIYFLDRLHDDSSYPNNSNGTTGIPPIQYYIGSIGFPAGTLSPTGSLTKLRAPRGVGKFYVVNRCAAALPSSASNMTLRYRLYSEQA